MQTLRTPPNNVFTYDKYPLLPCGEMHSEAKDIQVAIQ